MEKLNGELYGPWFDPARQSDFVRVQTYSRRLVGSAGILTVPASAERTQTGDEFYPQALAETIRYAAARTGRPIYIIENASCRLIRQSPPCAAFRLKEPTCAAISIGHC